MFKVLFFPFWGINLFTSIAGLNGAKTSTVDISITCFRSGPFHFFFLDLTNWDADMLGQENEEKFANVAHQKSRRWRCRRLIKFQHLLWWEESLNMSKKGNWPRSPYFLLLRLVGWRAIYCHPPGQDTFTQSSTWKPQGLHWSTSRTTDDVVVATSMGLGRPDQASRVVVLGRSDL